ncbi:MAG: hypothetical protein JW870_07950, partial [Candidatus Delongbacteria bacterium]|nr:hypothetical protein [Candidatus Delongbacteria bacterium]
TSAAILCAASLCSRHIGYQRISEIFLKIPLGFFGKLRIIRGTLRRNFKENNFLIFDKKKPAGEPTGVM